MSDTDLRYTFTCPSCSGSFSISLDRIPPVKARFSCPRCGTAMDFPSREEARIYMMVQAGGADADASAAPDANPPGPASAQGNSMPTPTPTPMPAPRPAAPPPPPKLQPAPPPPRQAPRPAAPPPPPPAERGEQAYVIQKVGFEGDTFDRRGIRVLIRTGAVNPADSVTLDGAPAVRADQLPDLKSLFELRKNAKFTPPAVCPKHLDQLAHYVCAATRRPLCEECADERKFGGTAVRVCVHCAGNVEEIPVANE